MKKDIIERLSSEEQLLNKGQLRRKAVHLRIRRAIRKITGVSIIVGGIALGLAGSGMGSCYWVYSDIDEDTVAYIARRDMEPRHRHALFVENPRQLNHVPDDFQQLYNLALAFPPEPSQTTDSCLENILLSGENILDGQSVLPALNLIYDAQNRRLFSTPTHQGEQQFLIENVDAAFQKEERVYILQENTLYEIEENLNPRTMQTAMEFSARAYMQKIHGSNAYVILTQGDHHIVCGATPLLERQLALVDHLSAEHRILDLVQGTGDDPTLYIQIRRQVYEANGEKLARVQDGLELPGDKTVDDYDRIFSFLRDLDGDGLRDVLVVLESGRRSLYVPIINGEQAEIYTQTNIDNIDRLDDYRWVLPDQLMTHARRHAWTAWGAGR